MVADGILGRWRAQATSSHHRPFSRVAGRASSNPCPGDRADAAPALQNLQQVHRTAARNRYEIERSCVRGPGERRGRLGELARLRPPSRPVHRPSIGAATAQTRHRRDPRAVRRPERLPGRDSKADDGHPRPSASCSRRRLIPRRRRGRSLSAAAGCPRRHSTSRGCRPVSPLRAVFNSVFTQFHSGGRARLYLRAAHGPDRASHLGASRSSGRWALISTASARRQPARRSVVEVAQRHVYLSRLQQKSAASGLASSGSAQVRSTRSRAPGRVGIVRGDSAGTM